MGVVVRDPGRLTDMSRGVEFAIKIEKGNCLKSLVSVAYKNGGAGSDRASSLDSMRL